MISVVNMPRSLPLPAALLTMHPTPMPIPAGGWPTGLQLFVVLLGCAQPDPMDQGPDH